MIANDKLCKLSCNIIKSTRYFKHRTNDVNTRNARLILQGEQNRAKFGTVPVANYIATFGVIKDSKFRMA